MKEAELREALRAAIAASSPPPPMSTNTALVAARRARFRRRTAWTCIGSAAAVAVIAVASAVLAGAGSNAGSFSPAGPRPATIPPPSAGTSTADTAESWPTGPDGTPQEDRTARTGARFDQGVRLLNEVVAAVPTGYTAPDTPASSAPDQMPLRDSQAQFEERVNGSEVWSYMSSAAVAQGERIGRLLVEVHTAGNRLTGEPCALTQQFWGMTGQCQVVTIGPVQVGVVVRPYGDDRFDQWAAYRHPDGVVVFVAQSLNVDGSRPALTKLPFSPDQLAALALSDRFHLQ
jgi:hypothetical protein